MLDNKTKEYLRLQKETKYKFEDIDKEQLLKKLLKNIGDHDPTIRDQLIYSNLAHLLHDNHFDAQRLNDVLTTLMSDDYLFFDMENLDEYSVLKRSFSLLQIAILLYVGHRDHIFTPEVVVEVYNTMLSYMKQETIFSGYDFEVGWMHSLAHTADVLAQLVLYPEINEQMMETIFYEIANLFMNERDSFVSDEDERMVTALMNALDRKVLSNKTVIAWVNSLGDYERPTTYPEIYRKNINIKNLLRSLYFRMLPRKEYQYFRNQIVIVLNEKVKLH